MSQTYMTAKLNLTDGTIVYPQVSLDNVVNSINDPTLATIATGISISVDGGTATLVTNGGSGVAKFVGANGLVVSMNEGNEVVFTAPSVTSVGSAGYADNAGSAVSAGTASVASSLVSSYVVSSATNATSAGTAAAITSGAIVGGYKTEIISGNTVGQMKWFNIVNTAGATVTVEPGEAYKINVANSAVTISATLGTVGQWGQEGHAEIFVAGTGNVHTGANVTLADGLEPDSVNNCTLRFHDGKCIISVEDHVAGYIVVSATGTSAGTLYYALGTASEEYIAVDASLNGTTLDLAGAVAEGEKHIVGNGYNETAISGTIDCSTNKVTVANLSLQDVGITSGTLTLGDVYIPDGSTVAVSGGGRLAVKKVTGAGSDSLIDLGENNIIIASGGTAYASGCRFSRDRAGEVINVTDYRTLILSSCSFVDNYFSIVVAGGRAVALGGNVFSKQIMLAGNGALEFAGENTIGGRIFPQTSATAATVTCSSGAILDLTGNTNATPIAPGGGVVIPSDMTLLYTSGGSTISGVISGGLANVTAIASGGVISGGVMYPYANTVSYEKLTFNGTYLSLKGNVTFSNCVSPINYTVGSSGTTITLAGSNTLRAVYTSSSPAVPYDVVITDGAIVDLTPSIWDGVIQATGDLIIGSGVTCITKGGSTVSITSGTYSNSYVDKNGEIKPL